MRLILILIITAGIFMTNSCSLFYPSNFYETIVNKHSSSAPSAGNPAGDGFSAQINTPLNGQQVGFVYKFSGTFNNPYHSATLPMVSFDGSAFEPATVKGNRWFIQRFEPSFGDHSNSIFLTDSSNHVSGTNTVLFNRAVIPSIAFDNVNDFDYINQPSLSFQGQAYADGPDAISNITFSVNGNPISEMMNSAWNFSSGALISGATNTVTVAVNTWSNFNASETVHVMLDIVPPVVTVNTPTNNQEVSGNTLLLSGTISDDFSGTANIFITLDSYFPGIVNISGNTWTCNEDLTVIGTGQHSNTISASDLAGNISTVLNLYFSRPSVPLIYLNTYSNNSAINYNNINLYGMVTIDPPYLINNITLSLNGGAPNPLNYTPPNWDTNSLILSLEQNNVLEIIAYGNNGLNSTNTYNIFVDTVSPALSITKPNRNMVYNHYPVFMGTANDSGSGVDSIYYSINGGAFSPQPVNSGSMSFSLPYLINGACRLDYYLSDKAGNFSATNDYIFSVSSIDSSTIAGPSPFNCPMGLAIDFGGNNIYVSDYSNHVIRVISNGNVSVFAGIPSTPGNFNSSADSSLFNYPAGIAIDSNGNIYVADSGNHCIRKIDTAGNVTTLAGSGSSGFIDGTGTGAFFSSPMSLVYDGLSGCLFVMDSGNYCVRKVTMAGVVTAFAGINSPGYMDAIGTNARFNYATGITADINGNLYVADSYNNRIRKIDPAGTVITIAGDGASSDLDGNGVAASLNSPNSLVYNNADNSLYITTMMEIRVLNTALGLLGTVAGDQTVAQGDVDGTAFNANYRNPWGIIIDNSQRLYISDMHNNKIKMITPQ